MDVGISTLSVNTWGHGQFYTQLDDTVYMIDPTGTGDKFSVYYLNTNSS